MRRVALLLIAGLCLASGACRKAPSTAESATDAGPEAEGTPAPGVPEDIVWHAGDLEVRQARVNLMPGMGALYLSVRNNGDDGDRLISASTPAAASAETHESVEDGDMVRMVAFPDGFEIPARGNLRLQPGGKHIMLIDPLADLGTEPILVTLTFEGAGTLDLEVPVMDLSNQGAVAPSMDHGDHG